ncbi:MAG: DEAD/DEAH box helicase, partial [Treponemataceae bacterium]|nr:DEAD/DEAH box helicase [Treponemataceae bacterium]
LILTAETAAGKSTAVPLALLEQFKQKIIMLEPRRLAALAIASRCAELLGETPGRTVGYRMRLDSKISAATRLEVITEAILTGMLQDNPALEGTDVVVLDEFHERSIHADLALAFLKEAVQLRDDLHVIVMSATMDTKPLAKFLGTDGTPAPVLSVPGRQFPVEFEYRPGLTPAEAAAQEIRRLQRAASVAEASSILVFLPGISDIRRCAAELRGYGFPDERTEVCVLHSSTDFSDQKKILSAPERGAVRVILSSAIAETSVTVPGVATVIDCGLARVSRMNVAAGMEHLVTETESEFSAAQRAGRAGRLAPGRCIRLWNEHDARIQRAAPEITRTDICPLVLECALWGISAPEQLQWLDSPPASAWNSAAALLEEIGCLKDGAVTPLGKTALKLGLHPRLACVALAGSCAAALEYSSFAKSSPDMQRRFLADLEQKVARLAPHAPKNADKSAALLAGFPDRIARRTETHGVYQFPSGRTARLPKEELLRAASVPEWIVAPEAGAGDCEGRIYSYLPLDSAAAEEWISARARTEVSAVFSGGAVQKTQSVCYGKIVLSSKKLPVQPEDYAAALCAEIRKNGLEILPLDEPIRQLLLRARFCEQQRAVPEAEQKSSEKALSGRAELWLAPFLPGKTRADSQTVFDALRWHLDGADIDRNAPQEITLPNGKKRRIRYEMLSPPHDKTKLVVRPVLEIIIQQVFGCFKTPSVMGMPVLLKLLSPARRPLQITDDLEHFWTSTWPEICKEMKGRYPKHNWNYKTCDD